MHSLFKVTATLGLASAIGGLNIIAQTMPVVSQNHHSSPQHSLPRSTTTTPSETPTPSPRASKIESFVNQGLDKLHKKDYTGALKDFDRVIQLNRTHQTAYFYRADIRS